MSITTKNDDKDPNQKINLKQLNERFSKRITLVKHGNLAMKTGNAKEAIKAYNTYLKIMADVKNLPDTLSLSPTHFDQQKELSELLLISHIYWDLSKLFDQSQSLETEFHNSLDKFIEFTSGFRYQVVNSEMMRKFIQKDLHQHKEAFREAYKKIYISSKRCYLAGHCFGEDHELTQTFRLARNQIAPTFLGQRFIDIYYALSPQIVFFCQKSRLLDFFLTKLLIRPCLSTMGRILRLILGKNKL